jgi:pimeloyl-ACP methyl ester carboxylesterase
MEGKLITIKTSDGLHLSGLLVEPKEQVTDIILNIHGTSGNFYWNGFYEPISKMALDLGLGFLSTNNRGSGVYELESGTVPNGASLEKFEDCLLDIDAWIEFCLEKGYKNIILEGHSFGTEKSVYYIAKGKHKDKIKAVILLGFSDTVGTQQKYEKKIGKNYFDEATKLVNENRGTELLSDLTGLCGELPISAHTYLNFFSEKSEIAFALPFGKGKGLISFQNIKVPVLGVISDNESGEYTIIPIKDAIELLKSENKLAEAYQIEDSSHGFEGKEAKLVEIITDFLKRRVLI